MGIRGSGAVALLLCPHQPQACPLLPREQLLTWRGGFGTWGASSPSTWEEQAKPHHVWLAARVRSMIPLTPIFSFSLREK